MEFLQEITLELNSNTAYTTVGAKQGDSQSRVIKIHVTENGADWTIPLGVTASYRIRKPDGYAIWNEAVIDNTENVVYVTLSEQSLAAAGRAYADVLFVSGTGEEKQVLSTVSFIIIIMASPDIASNVASSDEFSRILDITDNADVILNEAEAWAVGTKSGVPVIADAFSYAVEGGTFSCSIDEQVFRQQVGESPGYTRYFMFTCTGIPEGETENHWNVNYGNTTLADINLADYGITLTGTPLQSNIIRVVVTDSDLQYQNNAKYYAEQAAASKKAVDDLTVSAETVPVEQSASVDKTIEDDVVHFNFKIPKGDTGAQTYVQIRYSAVQPTQDSDMGTSPDAWMGIYTGTASSAPTAYTSYTWYKIKGEASYVWVAYSDADYLHTEGNAIYFYPKTTTQSIGYYNGSSDRTPSNPMLYNWVPFVSGTLESRCDTWVFTIGAGSTSGSSSTFTAKSQYPKVASVQCYELVAGSKASEMTPVEFTYYITTDTALPRTSGTEYHFSVAVRLAQASSYPVIVVIAGNFGVITH